MGNFNIRTIMSNIMLVFHTNPAYKNVSVSVTDINTMIPIYEFKSNTLSCAKFIGCMISQDPENAVNQVLALNTNQHERAIYIAIATNSKIPAMKNILRRISRLNKVFEGVYPEVNVVAVIDNKEYDANTGRIIDYFIANNPSIFGKTVSKVSCSFKTNINRETNKYRCDIKIKIDMEEE